MVGKMGVSGLLLGLGVLVLPVPGEAATYVVSPSGNDANSGSAQAPWATLQHAADAVSALPTTETALIDVQAGTYAGFFLHPSAPIGQVTFQAESGATIDRPRVGEPHGANIDIEGADGVTITGFSIEHAPQFGIRVVESAGVTVERNVVTDSQKTGIFTGFAPRVSILDNTVSGSVDEHGIYVSNSRVPDDRPIIRGNRTFGNGRSGIQLNGDCGEGGDGMIDDALIEANTVYGNHLKGLSIMSTRRARIENNIIYENRMGAGGIHLATEPGCDPALYSTRAAIVVNNTIYEPLSTGIRLSDGAAGNIIFNNIVVGFKLIVLQDSLTVANYIDTGSNLVRGNLDGIFVNPSVGDYHLGPTSPAIDLGVTSYHGAAAPQEDAEGMPRPSGRGVDAGHMRARGCRPCRRPGGGSRHTIVEIIDPTGAGHACVFTGR